MDIAVVLLLLLLVAGGVAFAIKSKSARSSAEFLSTDRPSPAPSAAAPVRVETTPSTTQADAPSIPGVTADASIADTDLGAANLDAFVPPEPSPSPVPPASTPEVRSESDETPAADDGGGEVATTVETAPDDDRPEPMVRARIDPSTTSRPAPAAVAVPGESHDDDDSAVLSRFISPGARVASIPVESRSPAIEAATVEETLDETTDPTPVDDVRPEPDDAAELEPAPAVTATTEADVRADRSGPDAPAEAVTVPEPDVGEAEQSEPDLVAPEIAPVVGELAEGGESDPVSEPEVIVALDGDPIPAADSIPDVEPGPTAGLEALSGAAAMSPMLDDPIVLTDEPVLAVAQLKPEPELDPVDHVLKALIHRAKEKQVGIAEVAAELVEQANLEDRDIDEVLADLVVRADDETVDSGERLEELTLFNDSVPRRPGQLTDFDRLDKNARKKVIIRVLCLLVAMQEDNRLKPSEPRSEAETRHWPLARAVWPVPVAESDDGADEGDGDKKLPGRRLARSSTKR